MTPRSDREKAQRVLADNRKALHDFARVVRGEVWPMNIHIVKRKQTHDKRETIRRREVDRETRAAEKQRNR